jgi:diguanylate cyclase (GGDEF)-like protein
MVSLDTLLSLCAHIGRQHDLNAICHAALEAFQQIGRTDVSFIYLSHEEHSFGWLLHAGRLERLSLEEASPEEWMAAFQERTAIEVTGSAAHTLKVFPIWINHHFLGGIGGLLAEEQGSLDAEPFYHLTLQIGLALENAALFERQQTTINYLLEHDHVLTQLPNRRLLRTHLNAAYPTNRRSVVALCYLDIDNFKSVNMRIGHLAADQLLIDFARRLARACAQADKPHMLARMGGDEFALLVEDLLSYDAVRQILTAVWSTLDTPFLIGGSALCLTISAGVHMSRSYQAHGDALLAAAERALRQAKESGKNCAVIYNQKDKKLSSLYTKGQMDDTAFARSPTTLHQLPKT